MVDVRLTNRTASAGRGSFSLRKTFVTLTIPSIRIPGETPPSAQAEPEDLICYAFGAEGVGATGQAGRSMRT
jgi:hypothetical protein